VFDLLYGGDLSEVGQDTLAGYNVNSIALQVPFKDVALKGDAKRNPVIGVWTTTERNGSGCPAPTEGVSDDRVQVSRLGNPLVNEVVVPAGLKDAFNSLPPVKDATIPAVVQRVNDPELPQLIEKIYGVPAPATPRDDIVEIFLTGITTKANGPIKADLNSQLNNADVNPTSSSRRRCCGSTCRYRSRRSPNGSACSPVDKQGFPNGRRLTDDVVDIEVQALEGAAQTGKIVDALAAGDKVNANDNRFGNRFPYLALPNGVAVNSRGGGSNAAGAPGRGAGCRRVARRPGRRARDQAGRVQHGRPYPDRDRDGGARRRRGGVDPDAPDDPLVAAAYHHPAHLVREAARRATRHGAPSRSKGPIMGRRLRFAIATRGGPGAAVLVGGRRRRPHRPIRRPRERRRAPLSRAQQRLHDCTGRLAHLGRARVGLPGAGSGHGRPHVLPEGRGRRPRVAAAAPRRQRRRARHARRAGRRPPRLRRRAGHGARRDRGRRVRRGRVRGARRRAYPARGRGRATAAVQRMLDLRPGLPAYARASYDLEQRGRVTEAADLMRRALGSAVDPHDVAFCRTQLGDLAWNAGDRDGARREYDAALAADPSTVAALRGRARVAGSLDDYGALVRRSPTPGYLLEYADLLRAEGRGAEAADQLRLAGVAQQLFTANGGTDGLTASSLAVATGDVAGALREAAGGVEPPAARRRGRRSRLGAAPGRPGRRGAGLRPAAAGTGAQYASYAYHLGAIELALGDRSAARTHLSQALATNPTFSPLDAQVARRLLTEVAS
jgi:tetratricopeptide (TPR) repeat protein